MSGTYTTEMEGYKRIFDTFGVEITEATVAMFDEASGKGCGDHQANINCLAIMIETFEEFEDDGTEITVPILCKIRALQAAYHMGLEQGKKAAQ